MDLLAPIRYLSLFSGAGGLDLAVRIALPNARCLGHVEIEVPAIEFLAARHSDGSLDDAPVYTDVRTFDGRAWRGAVDLIVGGFPCQDLSVAGKSAGIDGEKSGLWAEFARTIGEVRPRWVFVENVPGLLANEPMRRVLGDLSALGFDAEWLSLRASDVGASHRRERVFILAVADSGLQHEYIFQRAARDEFEGSINHVALPPVIGRREGRAESAGVEGRPDAAERGESVGDAESESRLLTHQHSGRGIREDASGNVEISGSMFGRRSGPRETSSGRAHAEPTGPGDDIFPPGPGDHDAWRDLLVRQPWLHPAISQAEAESAVCQCPDELAAIVVQQRTDALRALGNGVVPLQAAVALVELVRRMNGS